MTVSTSPEFGLLVFRAIMKAWTLGLLLMAAVLAEKGKALERTRLNESFHRWAHTNQAFSSSESPPALSLLNWLNSRLEPYGGGGVPSLSPCYRKLSARSKAASGAPRSGLRVLRQADLDEALCGPARGLARLGPECGGAGPAGRQTVGRHAGLDGFEDWSRHSVSPVSHLD